MEISEEILYILFGLAYFLYGLWKNLRKKPVTREEEGAEESEPQAEARRPGREQVSDPFDERIGRPRPANQVPSSFEELLEEFEGASEEANRKAEQKVRKVQEVDDEYEPVAGSAESIRSEEEAAKRIRETEMRKTLQDKASAAARAEVTDQELSRKRDQLLKGEEVVATEEKRFKAYRRKNKRSREILKILRNPESLKNTIVATEILRRRHF